MAQLNLKDIDDDLPAELEMVARQNGVSVKDYCVEALRAAIDGDMDTHAWRQRRRPAYLRDVLEGRIPACKDVRSSCKRYLKNLADPTKRIDPKPAANASRHAEN